MVNRKLMTTDKARVRRIIPRKDIHSMISEDPSQLHSQERFLLFINKYHLI